MFRHRTSTRSPVRVRAFNDPHAPDHVDVLDGQAQEPVEGFDQIDVDQLRLAVAFDPQLVLVRVAECFDVEERLAPRLSTSSM